MTQPLKKDALLKACVNNKGDTFEVIKTQRKAVPIVSTMIGGVDMNIQSHFANI